MSALIRVVISAPFAQVRPGERIEVTLAVQNFSEVVDRYKIIVEGIDPAWVTLSRDEVALFPKDQDEVLVTFHPPAGPEARADRYDIQIRVVSQENPGEQTVVSLDLEVQALTALELVLRPQRSSGMGEGTFNLQVGNRGNADLTVRFEASDPEEGLQYAFEPPQMLLPAGQEGTVRLRLRPRAPLTSAQPKVYPFTITARPTEDPRLAQQIRGEWVQTVPAFELSLQPQRGSGVGDGELGLRVVNRGSDELTLQFEATDPEGTLLYAFEPLQVTLSAAQEQSVRLRLRPKSPLPGEQSRTVSFTVTARTVGPAVVTQQAEGQWEQLPPAFDLALRPQRQSGAEGTFALQVRNLGDAGLSVQFEGEDPELGCLYSFSPAQVTVPAGQEGTAQLQVQPKAALFGEQPRTYAFTVTARPDSAPRLTRQVQGQFEQVPRRGPQLRPKTNVVGPLVLLLIGWSLAWFLGVLLGHLVPSSAGEQLFRMLEPLGGGEFADFVIFRVIHLVLRGIVAGIVGGLLTGLALSVAGSRLSGKQVFGIMGAWLACWIAAQVLLLFLDMEGLSPLFWAILGAVVGAAGGALTGQILSKVEPGVKTAIVAAGWAIAWAVGQLLAALWPISLPELFWKLTDSFFEMGFGDPSPALLQATFMGFLAGLVGGAVMLWHLSQARKPPR